MLNPLAFLLVDNSLAIVLPYSWYGGMIKGWREVIRGSDKKHYAIKKHKVASRG